MSSSTNSGITFEYAEREFKEAWNNPSHTQFDLPSVNVNKVLKGRYWVASDKRITRSMIWDMETKKAWDPLFYIPYVVSEARSWTAQHAAGCLQPILPLVLTARLDHAGERIGA